MRLLADATTSVTVKIGEEQPEEGLRSTSMVSMGFGKGAIGILGPTRMDYAQACAVVEAVAEHLSQTLSRLAYG